jgi:hypothetical protein
LLEAGGGVVLIVAMTIKSLDDSIGEALLLFFASCEMPMDEPPGHLIAAIKVDIKPIISQ